MQGPEQKGKAPAESTLFWHKSPPRGDWPNRKSPRDPHAHAAEPAGRAPGSNISATLGGRTAVARTVAPSLPRHGPWLKIDLRFHWRPQALPLALPPARRGAVEEWAGVGRARATVPVARAVAPANRSQHGRQNAAAVHGHALIAQGG